MTKVTSLTVKPFDRATGVAPRPSIILFDSLDGQVHSNDNEIRDMEYFEYGEIWFDGSTKVMGARKMQTRLTENGGVVIRATAEITDGNETLYAAITGDQVAITNIRLSKPTA